jgi:hypothetical protein
MVVDEYFSLLNIKIQHTVFCFQRLKLETTKQMLSMFPVQMYENRNQGITVVVITIEYKK